MATGSVGVAEGNPRRGNAERTCRRDSLRPADRPGWLTSREEPGRTQHPDADDGVHCPGQSIVEGRIDAYRARPANPRWFALDSNFRVQDDAPAHRSRPQDFFERRLGVSQTQLTQSGVTLQGPRT